MQRADQRSRLPAAPILGPGGARQESLRETQAPARSPVLSGEFPAHSWAALGLGVASPPRLRSRGGVLAVLGALNSRWASAAQSPLGGTPK